MQICRRLFHIEEESGTAGRKSRFPSAWIHPPNPCRSMEPQFSFEETESRCRWLKGKIVNSRIAMNYHDPGQGFVENVREDRRPSPGDRKSMEGRGAGGEVVRNLCFSPGCRLSKGGNRSFRLLHPACGREEPFPWDHIDPGVSREFLWRERDGPERCQDDGLPVRNAPGLQPFRYMALRGSGEHEPCPVPFSKRGLIVCARGSPPPPVTFRKEGRAEAAPGGRFPPSGDQLGARPASRGSVPCRACRNSGWKSGKRACWKAGAGACPMVLGCFGPRRWRVLRLTGFARRRTRC